MDTDARAQIDALIARFYAAFDNRDHRPFDEPGLRRLFLPEARVTRVAGGQVESWTLDEFIAPRRALLGGPDLVGFHEWETERETTLLADIAHRRSRYEKTGTLRGQPYGGRGSKLILLARTREGWRITSVLWEDD